MRLTANSAPVTVKAMRPAYRYPSPPARCAARPVTGSAEILKASLPIVDAVATTLTHHTEFTLIEVGVYYTPPIHVFLTPVLLVLSAVKFVLVVGFYMHLKFDNRLFSALFSLGLIIAGSLMISLLFLFRSYFVEALLHPQ